MSGSGGFYKYRCKYFYTYNCPNWVYCNGHACAMCLAEGRDSAEAEAGALSRPHASATWQQAQQQQQQHQRRQNATASTEICVPQAIHGTLRYTVMEIIPSDEPGNSGAYWVLRQKVMAAQALPYSTFTTSDTPRPVMTSVGVPGQMVY